MQLKGLPVLCTHNVFVGKSLKGVSKGYLAIHISFKSFSQGHHWP